MGDRTAIEWTDASLNPIRARNKGAMSCVGWHCEKVSEACRNCYAESMNKRLGTGLDYKPGNLDKVQIFLDEKMLLAPLRWKKPRKIFVCSTTDLFGDWVKDEWLDRIFAVMALCPQHTFQCLTKRPKRMREYFIKPPREVPTGKHDPRNSRRHVIYGVLSGIASLKWGQEPRYVAERMDALWYSNRLNGGWPLPNVWLGTTVENQEAADARIPDLLATPAAVRFVSCEPMLGPIDLREIDISGDACITPLTAHSAEELTEEWGEPIAEGQPRLDWIITGGESGPHARPSHPDWFRSLRDQCAAAGPAYFHKQNGEWAPGEAIKGVQTRTEVGATWFAGKWMEERITPKIAESLHCDDEPDVWCVGKRRAGRLLDGVEHSAFPALSSVMEK